MKFLKFLFILIIILGAIAGGGYLYAMSYYNSAINDKSGSGKTVEIEIVKGASTDQIAKTLKEKGLIKNELVFKYYLRQTNKGGQLKAGKYEFKDTQTIKEIVDEMGKGGQVKGIQVRLLEGYTSKQMSDAIAKKYSEAGVKTVTASELNMIITNPDSQAFPANIKTYLAGAKPAGKSLEGFLYPDTYEFAKDAKPVDIIAKMLQNFINKTAGLDTTGSSRTFYQSLVLASIVERESFTNEERPTIASVFSNRLKIGMALQSDATVNYATGKSDPQPTFEDLKTDSPYNTYKYPGLPPTPISNPRLESIKAAINPAQTDYYYFIHEQDGSGQVHFAKTDTEHYANVRKYLNK